MFLCSILLLWGEARGEGLILEVGCSFDGSMEQAFARKLLKYQPRVARLDSLGWRCKLVGLIFGSLGHVHRRAARGLQTAGLTKTRAKHLARYCSVSAVVGSLAVWRRVVLSVPLSAMHIGPFETFDSFFVNLLMDSYKVFKMCVCVCACVFAKSLSDKTFQFTVQSCVCFVVQSKWNTEQDIVSKMSLNCFGVQPSVPARKIGRWNTLLGSQPH